MRQLIGPRLRSLLLLGLLFSLVGCDHVTKAIAKSELQAQPPTSLIEPLLKLRYLENTDVAFNMLRWVPLEVRGPLLLATGALALLAVGALLFRAQLTDWARAGLVLVLAGAIGNYADRVARGYVVDFIQIKHWPVFNVADVLIVVGGAVLLLTRLHRPRALA